MKNNESITKPNLDAETRLAEMQQLQKALEEVFKKGYSFKEDQEQMENALFKVLYAELINKEQPSDEASDKIREFLTEHIRPLEILFTKDKKIDLNRVKNYFKLFEDEFTGEAKLKPKNSNYIPDVLLSHPDNTLELDFLNSKLYVLKSHFREYLNKFRFDEYEADLKEFNSLDKKERIAKIGSTIAAFAAVGFTSYVGGNTISEAVVDTYNKGGNFLEILALNPNFNKTVAYILGASFAVGASTIWMNTIKKQGQLQIGEVDLAEEEKQEVKKINLEDFSIDEIKKQAAKKIFLRKV